MVEFRDVTDADCGRIQRGMLAMQHAPSLEATAIALVDAATDLVACDHGGYTEVDLHFGRTHFHSSEPDIEALVELRMPIWGQFMPDHPVLRHRTENPDVATVRLSDVISLSDFYNSGLYHELFREVDTDHQLVMHLGFDPRYGRDLGAQPLTLGVPLNRKGRDFTDRDVQVLTMLRQVAGPVLRRKRAEHQLRLLDAAELSPDLLRSLIGLGLTRRQAEVAFWMLKGKSNTDVGTILEMAADTVRQHSVAIFRRLGVGGRIALQRTVFRALADFD